MKSIYDLTPEELKHADPKGIKQLIAIDEAQLKCWSIPDYQKAEIRKELAFLNNLLNDLEGDQ